MIWPVVRVKEAGEPLRESAFVIERIAGPTEGPIVRSARSVHHPKIIVHSALCEEVTDWSSLIIIE